MTREEFLRQAAAVTEDRCVPWPGAVRASSGYGAHNHKRAGKTINFDVHAYSCMLAHGPRPSPQYEAAHSCGDKLCVSGAHLRWALRVENMADAKALGTLRGGGRYRQRLFAPEIAIIRDSAESLVSLASRFQSDPAYMGRVRRAARLAA